MIIIGSPSAPKRRTLGGSVGFTSAAIIHQMIAQRPAATSGGDTAQLIFLEKIKFIFIDKNAPWVSSFTNQLFEKVGKILKNF